MPKFGLSKWNLAVFWSRLDNFVLSASAGGLLYSWPADENVTRFQPITQIKIKVALTIRFSFYVKKTLSVLSLFVIRHQDLLP